MCYWRLAVHCYLCDRQSLSNSNRTKNKPRDLLVQHVINNLMVVKLQFFKNIASMLPCFHALFKLIPNGCSYCVFRVASIRGENVAAYENVFTYICCYYYIYQHYTLMIQVSIKNRLDLDIGQSKTQYTNTKSEPLEFSAFTLVHTFSQTA